METIRPDNVDGRRSMINYIWEARDDSDLLRQRYSASNLQMVLCYFIGYIFARNAICVGKIVVRYPRRLAPWCSFCANSVSFLSYASAGAPFWLTENATCSTFAWATLFAITISSMICNLMLFERAYFACQRNIWFTILGVILITVPGPIYVATSWLTSSALLSEKHACYLKYPPFLPYVRLAVDLPSNIVFSIVFSIVVYRQYRKHPDECWKELGRNGILTMLMVVVSNFICFFLGVANTFAESSSLVYMVDWVVTMTLLTESTRCLYFIAETNASKNRSSRRTPGQDDMFTRITREAETSVWPEDTTIDSRR
ncbi:hypothetical protein BDF22DRAFT_490429 [Syncephalis plumigaleata]|nr:hypothetical protein BDF22DRAFT_490429 [Syncephalis plumigaleata]